MNNFNHKKSWKNIVQSVPVLILLSILILIFTWNIFSLFKKMNETGKNKEITQKEVIDLKSKKEKLSLDIETLKTEKGQDKVFRETFGLGKEGEEVVVIIEDKNKNTEEKEQESKGFFVFLKNLFK